MSQCPCQSDKEYDACCGPIISGSRAAPTAECLMRSRYSAFAKGEIDYLRDSIHPDHRTDFDPVAIRDWAMNSKWTGLQIVTTNGGGEDAGEGTVEFIAHFRFNGTSYQHHEVGQFNRLNGVWYYTDGTIVTADSGS
jgi:SEC-C motif-containing protein